MRFFNLLKGTLLIVFIFGLSLFSLAQTTYNFDSGATITTPPGSPWATEAVVTIGGVNYKLTSGGNGGWSLSANNGNGNSASLRKTGSGGDTFRLERVDGQPFNFYSIYVRHEGYNSYNGQFGIVLPPWYTVTYDKVSGAAETDLDNSPLVGGSNAITTTINTFSRTLTVNSVDIFFKANNSYWIDDIRVGTATGTEVAPTVTTATPTTVQSNSAVLGGNVTADGGAAVTDRGIVWSTSGTPTTSNNKIQITSGTGVFSSIIGSLPAGTQINYRAYAINSKGTSYGANIQFTTQSQPVITSATYNAQSGLLIVTGTNFQAKAGAANDVDVSRLGLFMENGINFSPGTLADVEISSATSFSLTISGPSKPGADLYFNKNGTVSTGGSVYNLSAADGWMANVSGGQDLNTPITVTNVAIPTITSATYNAALSSLFVTGTGFLSRGVAANDIQVSNLAIKGQGGATYTLTSPNVNVSSATDFGIGLNAADKAALVSILNKNGLSAQDGTAYNLIANDNWDRGADAALSTADLTGNTIQATLPITLLPTTLANPVYASAYSQSITGSGGTGTYTFAIVAGALPGGISLSAAGILSGTPTQTGNYNFTVRATDGASATGTFAYSITIAAPTITLSPATVPNPVVAVAYSQSLSSTGGASPYTYAISAGALPAGLSLSSAGILSGIPTAFGAFSFTVQATDAGLFAGIRAYTVNIVQAAITLIPATLPNPTVATAYSQSLSSSGGIAPYSYAITAGALPAGLSLSATGVVSGNATTVGNFTFTVTSTDASLSSKSQLYNVTVGAPTVVISPSTLPNPALVTVYSQTLSATGGTGPYTYSLTAGALPPGLNISGAGIVSGTATAFGTFNFTITATDALAFSTSRAYTVSIAQASITVTPPVLPGPVYGIPYNQSLSSSGGTAPYSYALTSGALPTGLSLSSAGVFSGTAATIGSYPITVTVTDATLSTKNQNYGLVVASPALTIGPATLPDAVLGTVYTQVISTTGGIAPYTYSVSTGILPSGISLSSGGTLSGTPTAFGAFGFTITSNDASSAVGTKVYSLNIAQADISITPANLPNPVLGTAYSQAINSSGGTSPYTYAITAGALPSGLSLSSNGTFSGTATATGSYTFTVKSTDALSSSKAAPYTIIVAAPTIALVPAALPGGTVGTVYSQSLTASGGTAPYLYSINAGALPAGISLSSAGILSGSPTAGGSSSFTVQATDATGGLGPYSANKNYVLDIGYKTQGITFSAAATVNYGDADFAPAATSDSGLPVSYSTSDASIAVIVAGKVQIKKAGVVTIFADQPGNSVFAPAPQREQILTINKAILLYTSAAVGKAYGDPLPTLNGTIGGFKYTDNLTNSVTGTAVYSTTANALSPVGTYAVNGSGLGSENYTFAQAGSNANALTVSAKPINIVAVAQSKSYGDADPALAYTFSPALLGTDTFSGSLIRVTGENVGTYAINQGGITLNANYTISYTGANLVINKKAVTVTAVAKSKGFGNADPALTYTFTPLLGSGDNFTGSLSRVPGETVGTYAINQGSLALSSNYALNYIGADLTIAGKTIMVTAVANSKTYGDAEPAFTYTFSPSLGAGDSFTGSLSRVPGETVGTYAINQGSLALNANYTLSFTGADLTITKKTIAVTAAGGNKSYGDADPVLTYTLTPALVTGDTFTGSLNRAAGETVGTYAINQGNLALNANYTLSYIGADLTIGKKAIAVKAVAKNKNYGDADPLLTYTFAPALVTGDTFTGSLTRVAGETVGTYTINQGSLVLNTNYTLSYTGGDLTIGKKAIAVTAIAKGKAYGDADPVLTYTFSPVLGTGDSFTGTLTRMAGETVGTYAINQGSLALNANYTLSYTGANLTIARKTITVTAVAKSKAFGDADPVLTYTLSPTLATGDTFTGALDRVAGESVGTYAINQGSLALNSNYTLNYIGADLLINKKTITVTAAAKSKGYGDADPLLTYTFSPALSTGDSFSGSLGRSVGENAGIYAITSTLGAGVNYAIDFKTANLTINKAALTVVADAKQVCQGAELPAFTLGYSGFKFSDNENSLTTKPLVNSTGNRSSAAGDYVLSPVGGVSANYTFNYTNGVLKINPLPVIAINSDKGTNISRGETVKLTASGAVNYVWSAASGVISGQNTASLNVRPRESTTYTVTGTNGSGCSQTQSVTLTVAEDLSKIKANNILTPNNDGFNDKWVIENIDYYPNNEVKIFDKAGRIIYSKKAYDNSWDGTVNGTALSEGTYYYIIDFGTGKMRVKGFITLVREN
jgi:gliding motility-associated-like protein